MTPFDLVGMAALNGLELLALTDHNTARNCPAAAAAAQAYGVGFIPGIEVTTSEDVHAICLFPSLAAALEFDRFLYERLPNVLNKTAVFGRQLLFDTEGRVCGEEPRLLILGCSLSILELPETVRPYGGICYPAHVDRVGNGLMSILGAWPHELHTLAAEIHACVPPGLPEGLHLIRASDAHQLLALPEEGFVLPLDTPDFNGLCKWLKSKSTSLFTVRK